MINFYEKEEKNEDSEFTKNQNFKKKKDLIFNEDIDQICLDNINDLLY